MTGAATPTRSLAGVELFPIAFGPMPLSLRDDRPDTAEAVRTIHAALDGGVTLIDTADAYAHDASEVGHNERLVARALRGRDDDVLIATKGGKVRTPDGWRENGRPEHIRAACEASLTALGRGRIDLYQLHAPDPDVPLAETVGALAELRDAGKVRWVGLANVDVAQLDAAREIVEIAAIQNRLGPDFPDSIERGEPAACAERGVAFLAWGPFGGFSRRAAAPGGVTAVRHAAERHSVSPYRVVLAWLLWLGPTVVPIVGASRPETIGDSLRAIELTLTDEELRAIDAEVRARSTAPALDTLPSAC